MHDFLFFLVLGAGGLVALYDDRMKEEIGRTTCTNFIMGFFLQIVSH